MNWGWVGVGVGTEVGLGWVWVGAGLELALGLGLGLGLELELGLDWDWGRGWDWSRDWAPSHSGNGRRVVSDPGGCRRRRFTRTPNPSRTVVLLNDFGSVTESLRRSVFDVLSRVRSGRRYSGDTKIRTLLNLLLPLSLNAPRYKRFLQGPTTVEREHWLRPRLSFTVTDLGVAPARE